MIEPLVTALGGAVAGALAVAVLGRARAGRATQTFPVRPDQPDAYEDERTHRVLAAFPFAAFLIDANGIVRFANDAAEELFEINAERAAGQALIAVVPQVALERQV